MDFDSLEPSEVPFGKIAGVEYVIREPDEGTASAYEGARVKGGTLAPLEKDAKPEDARITYLNDSLLESRAVLIGGCLFKKGEASPVGIEFAKKLKRSISNPAFDKALEIYNLADKQEKNGQLKN